MDEMPEAGNDPGDPLISEIEEEKPTPTLSLADPTLDEEVAGANEVDKDDLSDLESELSEVDERQFADFNVEDIAIEDRPAIAVDETTVGQLGRHKRKRVEGEDGEARKRKEKRREKPKKNRRRREDTEEFEGGQTIDGKRTRKPKRDGETNRRQALQEEEDDESLTPDERRRRALDRKMDEALRNPNQRRGKKDGLDLEQYADKEIERMRDRMIAACQEDGANRIKGLPGMKKLELLPEVKNLLNRTQLASQIVDPELNLLEAVKFFLEPLTPDGVLPAYSIQRELFAALAKLPISKQALISSGIGRVVLFYTKSRQPEDGIKRQAEKLLSMWMRQILKRSDDYRKRHLPTATYDPASVMRPAKKQKLDTMNFFDQFNRRLVLHPSSSQSQSQSQHSPTTAERMAARDVALARPQQHTNRARVEGHLGVYTVVPKAGTSAIMPAPRAPGQGGEDAFRRMKVRQQGTGRRH